MNPESIQEEPQHAALGVPLDDQSMHLKRAILKDALREDPKVLVKFGKIIPGLVERRVEKNPQSIGLFARHAMIRTILNVSESILNYVDAETLPALIAALRRNGQSSYLTVSPCDAERQMIYGGTSKVAVLRLWFDGKSDNDTLFCQATTRNKQAIRDAIAMMRTHEKLRVQNEFGPCDLYWLEHEEIPKKLHIWD